MIAIEQLENKINKKIVPAGLMVDLNQPFLAVSPDDLIGLDSLDFYSKKLKEMMLFGMIKW
ncbi:hypothetical protein QTP88_000845 [Uroleucon formosanum]